MYMKKKTQRSGVTIWLWYFFFSPTSYEIQKKNLTLWRRVRIYFLSCSPFQNILYNFSGFLPLNFSLPLCVYIPRRNTQTLITLTCYCRFLEVTFRNAPSSAFACIIICVYNCVFIDTFPCRIVREFSRCFKCEILARRTRVTKH